MQHSEVLPNLLPNNNAIIALNAFSDNYIWVVQQENNQHVIIVDPGDADVCIRYLQQNNKKLAAILVTHHHFDHIGGVETLLAYSQQQGDSPQIYGPSFKPLAGSENLPIPKKHHITTHVQVNGGETITIAALGLSFSVLPVPGHTLEHIAFYSEQALLVPVLFSGDALFSGGCGRLFEGNAEQMLSSLTTLSKLPSETQIYCAHEYTLNNLAFACYLEPNNQPLAHYQKKVQQLRNNNTNTLPSTIGLERAVNPFLRCQQAVIQKQVCEHFHLNHLDLNNLDINNESAATEILAALRKWKDTF